MADSLIYRELLDRGLHEEAALEPRHPLSLVGGPAGQMPPEMAEMQKAQMRLMMEEAPQLYAFEERLQGIEAEIGKTIKGFAVKEIDKDTAKEQLLPLLKEERKIRENPDFQAEQRLAQVVFSSPEHQEKMRKIINALAEKRKRKARQ